MPPKTATKAATTASASTQVLLLTQKAEVKETKLNTAPDGTITIAMLKALLKKKEAPEFIGSYKHKSHTLFLFGYLKGKAGTENKHELPPPHDTVLLFGDAILLASQSENDWTCPVLLKAADYESFYTRAFGGFEDIDEEDNDEENEIEDEIEDAVDAAIEDEGGEEDAEEEVEEEVDEEEDVEEEAVEDDEEGGGGEDIAPISKKGRNGNGAGGGSGATANSKAKKARRPAPTGTTGANSTGAYGIQLHIPEGQELREEWPCPGTELQALCPARKKVHNFIQSYFKDLLEIHEIDEFERCIYNSTIRKADEKHISKAWSHQPFMDLYHTIAKMLTSNFHPDAYVKNTELYQRYKDGIVTFADICGMDSYQLFEGRWKDNFIQQQLQEKRQLEGNRALATDRFLCTRCWKRECTYYEMQTRSADEPMTIFITCVNCGKHWRQ
jgi:DNA-directed RNA polymerase subunit M/transcription elongation factor TFIIS